MDRTGSARIRRSTLELERGQFDGGWSEIRIVRYHLHNASRFRRIPVSTPDLARVLTVDRRSPTQSFRRRQLKRVEFAGRNLYFFVRDYRNVDGDAPVGSFRLEDPVAHVFPSFPD